MRKIIFFLTFIFSITIYAQEETQVKGTVFTVQNNLPLENVNVLNLNQVKGTTTNIKGEFNIRAAVNDTLYFSHCLMVNSEKVAWDDRARLCS